MYLYLLKKESLSKNIRIGKIPYFLEIHISKKPGISRRKEPAETRFLSIKNVK